MKRDGYYHAHYPRRSLLREAVEVVAGAALLLFVVWIFTAYLVVAAPR